MMSCYLCFFVFDSMLCFSIRDLEEMNRCSSVPKRSNMGTHVQVWHGMSTLIRGFKTDRCKQSKAVDRDNAYMRFAHSAIQKKWLRDVVV